MVQCSAKHVTYILVTPAAEGALCLERARTVNLISMAHRQTVNKIAIASHVHLRRLNLQCMTAIDTVKELTSASIYHDVKDVAGIAWHA